MLGHRTVSVAVLCLLIGTALGGWLFGQDTAPPPSSTSPPAQERSDVALPGSIEGNRSNTAAAVAVSGQPDVEREPALLSVPSPGISTQEAERLEPQLADRIKTCAAGLGSVVLDVGLRVGAATASIAEVRRVSGDPMPQNGPLAACLRDSPPLLLLSDTPSRTPQLPNRRATLRMTTP